MKITKNMELEVPSNTFTYDLAHESIRCGLCDAIKIRTRLNEEKPEELDSLFQTFALDHFDCLLKAKPKDSIDQIFDLKNPNP